MEKWKRIIKRRVKHPINQSILVLRLFFFYPALVWKVPIFCLFVCNEDSFAISHWHKYYQKHVPQLLGVRLLFLDHRKDLLSWPWTVLLKCALSEDKSLIEKWIYTSIGWRRISATAPCCSKTTNKNLEPITHVWEQRELYWRSNKSRNTESGSRLSEDSSILFCSHCF